MIIVSRQLLSIGCAAVQLCTDMTLAPSNDIGVMPVTSTTATLSPHDDMKVKTSTLTSATLSDSLTDMRRASMRSKPPNVLIYCGKKDSSRLFASIKSVLSQCINIDQYIIYHLKHDQVISTPWRDNTALLVIASDKVYDGVDQQFLQYFVDGGTLISFGSVFDSLIVERTVRLPALSGQLGVVTVCCDGHDAVSVISSKFCYSPTCQSVLSDVTLTYLARDSVTQQPVIVEAVHQSSAGLAILSQVSFSLCVCVCVCVCVHLSLCISVIVEAVHQSLAGLVILSRVSFSLSVCLCLCPSVSLYLSVIVEAVHQSSAGLAILSQVSFSLCLSVSLSFCISVSTTATATITTCSMMHRVTVQCEQK